MVKHSGQKYAFSFLLSVVIPSQFRKRQQMIVVLVCVLRVHTVLSRKFQQATNEELCNTKLFLAERRECPQVRLSSFQVH